MASAGGVSAVRRRRLGARAAFLLPVVTGCGLGLAATTSLAADTAPRPISWEVSACHAWRDHLHFVIDVRTRTGSGLGTDLEAIRDAVDGLARRCESGDARKASELLALLLNLLVEEEDGS